MLLAVPPRRQRVQQACTLGCQLPPLRQQHLASCCGHCSAEVAFDTYPSRKASWEMQHFRTPRWKQSETGATDTTGVATVLTSRICPPSAFYSNGSAAMALTTALLRAVNNGINLQIALLLGALQVAPMTMPSVSTCVMGFGTLGASGWILLEPDSTQIRTIEKVRLLAPSFVA